MNSLTCKFLFFTSYVKNRLTNTSELFVHGCKTYGKICTLLVLNNVNKSDSAFEITL